MFIKIKQISYFQTEKELLKAHNHRLMNFPPLAAKNTNSPGASTTYKTVELSFMFGCHGKPAASLKVGLLFKYQ